jgi:hypothetical protein
MINWPKLIVFIIATILMLINISIYTMYDDWAGVFYVLLLYVILIVIALYDIGKDL